MVIHMVSIQNKAYSKYSGACGGLCVPSTALVSFITQCEQVFSSNVMSMLHMSKVCDRRVNALLKNVDMSWFSSTGCSGNIPLIVRIYMKMRIFYAVKFFNQSLMLLSHCGEYPCECKNIYSRQIRQKVANIRRMGLRMQFATIRNDRKLIASHS